MGAAIAHQFAANNYQVALMSNSGGAETLAAEWDVPLVPATRPTTRNRMTTQR